MKKVIYIWYIKYERIAQKLCKNNKKWLKEIFGNKWANKTYLELLNFIDIDLNKLISLDIMLN